MWVEIIRRGFVQGDEIFVDMSIGKANTLISMGICQPVYESRLDEEIQKYQALKEMLFDGTHPECVSNKQEQMEFEEDHKDDDVKHKAFLFATQKNIESGYKLNKQEFKQFEDNYLAALKEDNEQVSKAVAQDLFSEKLDNKMVKQETVKKKRGRKPRVQEQDTGEYNLNG